MPVDRAMDTLVSSMIASSKRQDLLANNIANANTVGFKKDSMSFASIFDGEKIKAEADIPGKNKTLHNEVFYGHLALDMPVKVDEQFTDFETGSLQITNNPLDVAIQGDGLFSILTPEGERFTRQGNFTLNEANYIVTKHGYPVLGENGPIQIDGDTVSILEDGSVQVDGDIVTRLRISDTLDKSVPHKIGDGLYDISEENRTQVLHPQLSSGYVESSNVNTIREINMMTVNMRAFEANSKAVKTIERTISRAITGVGK